MLIKFNSEAEATLKASHPIHNALLALVVVDLKPPKGNRLGTISNIELPKIGHQVLLEYLKDVPPLACLSSVTRTI